MIDFTIRVVPPKTTAQQKRVRVVRSRKSGKHVPMFFQSAEMEAEANTWASLLRPHVPAAPMSGPVELSIAMVYPYLKSTRKRDVGKLLPKVSKPDCGNAAKHLEDLLAKMRFLNDDAQVARLTLEKWHGPEHQVGIRIRLEALSDLSTSSRSSPMTAGAAAPAQQNRS